MKTLTTLLRQDKEKINLPRSIQETIPIRCLWPDGVFLCNGKYTKTFKFEDINYTIAGKEDRESMFLKYSALLNSLDSGVTAKITMNNRRLNQKDFESEILGALKGDALDVYRKEWNAMLLEKAIGEKAQVQEHYLTISVAKPGIDEARAYFARIGTDLAAHFVRLGSRCTELSATEKMRLLYDFYRPGEETDFALNLQTLARRGHSFKDYICPDSLDVKQDYFTFGKKFGRVLYLKEFANYIKDDMVAELCELNRNLMLSIDIIPVPTDEAVREVKNRLLGIDTNITNWQRRQNSNNNFSARIPYDMSLQRKETEEFLNDLTTRDQRMMFAVITLVHTADTKEQLDSDTETLCATARKHLCQLATLKYQQLDGLNTALPYGVRRINALRTLTTESVAVFMPFYVQEIRDEKGVYCGENAISRNLIFCNKAKLMNPNAFHLGVPGSGKSMTAKQWLMYLMLFTDDDILVCDPEGEYGILAEKTGGTVIKIAPGSGDHINALDMVDGYSDVGDPVIDKSEFVLSLFEQLDKEGIGPHEKSIIDRCTAAVYNEYRSGGALPTLPMLRKKLMEQPEPQAKALALAMEIFTDGSLDAFAYPTNVNTQNRFVVYDILNLGKQMKTMGLLVITDAMLNRVAENFKKKKRTHIFIDEFHVVFENEHSAEFFSSAWRRFRKRNAFPTAITQNVEYLLDSTLASTMLSNSEFLVLLNQAPSDRERLAKLLNISREQLSYITNADAGCGLIRYGSSLVPFVNKFPEHTQLFKLMSTKPAE
ncbi:MAG: ATP-binding protein [Oscillospiraceae bacterium]